MNKRVLLVDDHPLTRLGTKVFLTDHGYHIIGEAEDGTEAILMAERFRPAWIILDIGLPKLNGIQVIYHLLSSGLSPHIIVFSSQELNRCVHECIQAGAVGFVRKTAPMENLLCAMESAQLGHVWLPKSTLSDVKGDGLDIEGLKTRITPCERKVMALLLEGKSNNEVSQILNRSPKTTSAQKKSLLRKLNVSSFAELILMTTGERHNKP